MRMNGSKENNGRMQVRSLKMPFPCAERLLGIMGLSARMGVRGR
jgi:hypothetical protein